MKYDFTTNIESRLDAMLEAKNGDDVPFLVELAKTLRNQVADLESDVAMWKSEFIRIGSQS